MREIIFLISIVYSKCGNYNNCPHVVNDKLNVHLVPHTHDDVGWLKTVDQYYYGSNDTIKWANAGVQYILDTVIPHLTSDPTKRFIYVESAYFWRWYEEQTTKMKTEVKRLVEAGQLEFILGGWCMNDEATVHYTAMIQQLAFGVNYLSDLFGECGHPLIGWQIDPFGHSKVQAEIFARAGFDGLFFGRNDYQDKAWREQTRTMEFLWQSLRENSMNEGTLFTGVNQHGYNPPDGFCFDWVCEGDQPIMDDPRLHDYNVDDVIKRFKAAAEDQRKNFRGNNIMMTMGSDFQYRNAYMWYKNLDKLIKYVNEADVGLNLFYSTPSCYLKSRHSDELKATDEDLLTEKSDDFFPYADGPHMFWTGYFTSRAALKGYVRETNTILSQCRRAVLSRRGYNSKRLFELERNFAVAQHHDAVSGTERQHVAADYAQRLDEGRRACFETIQEQYKVEHDIDIEPCEYRNISVCAGTVDKSWFSLIVKRSDIGDYVRVPLSKWYRQRQVTVSVNTGNSDNGVVFLDAQIDRVSGRLKRLQQMHENAGNFELTIALPRTLPDTVKVDVDFVSGPSSVAHNQRGRKQRLRRSLRRRQKTFKVKTQYHVVEVTRTGTLKIDNVTIDSSLYYYDSSNNKTQPSGAYIFRPESNWAKPVPGRKFSHVRDGPVSYDVVYDYAYGQQTFRIMRHMPFIEHEFIIGPLPRSGIEVVARFNTNIKSGDEFYTDMNGRGLLKRKLNYRSDWKFEQTEPVAGNYYPINSEIVIRDEYNELAIVPDRAQGGSSMASGQIELMILRATSLDDGRGVDEPLNDPGQLGNGLIVKGSHLLHFRRIEPESEYYAKRRGNFFVGKGYPMVTSSMKPITTFNRELNQINDNIRVTSLEWITSDYNEESKPIAAKYGQIRLRLEHMCGPGSLLTSCEPAKFNFEDYFAPSFKVKRVTEFNIIGNFPLASRDRLNWQTRLKNDEFITSQVQSGSLSLKRTELRTFIVAVK